MENHTRLVSDASSDAHSPHSTSPSAPSPSSANPESWDIEVIERKLDEMRVKNERLALENETFSRFLARKDQSVSLGQAGGLVSFGTGGGSVGGAASVVDADTVSEYSESSLNSAHTSSSAVNKQKGNRKRRGRQDQVKNKLSLEQKIGIVKEEIEQWLMSAEREEHRIEDEIEDIRARMVESDIHVSDLRKEAMEFRRDILLQSDSDPGTVQVAEKIIRFFEEKIKQKDDLCKKLKLKNQSVRQSRKKQEIQLKQRDEAGETFDKVDYEQLKIEHSQYLEKIEEKNSELLQLKLTTANTVAALNGLKEELNNLIAESAWLRREISNRMQQQKRLEQEIDFVVQAKEKAVIERAHLKQQQEEIKVPEILEYVEQKRNMYELDKEVKNWERKVEIVEGQLKTLRSRMKQASIQPELRGARSSHAFNSSVASSSRYR